MYQSGLGIMPTRQYADFKLTVKHPVGPDGLKAALLVLQGIDMVCPTWVENFPVAGVDGLEQGTVMHLR